jgi:hypothetical protein
MNGAGLGACLGPPQSGVALNPLQLEQLALALAQVPPDIGRAVTIVTGAVTPAFIEAVGPLLVTTVIGAITQNEGHLSTPSGATRMVAWRCSRLGSTSRFGIGGK